MPFRFNILLVALGLFSSGMVSVSAQSSGESTLYVGFIQSRGYVVGASLEASGLARFDGGEQWTHIGWNTPRIVGIAVDPARPDTIYLASGNGVLRTFDGGEHWRIVTDWRVTEVQDVAVEPGRPSHVYLASAYGVWRSTDFGDTWTEANDGLLPPGRRYTETIEVDQTQPGRLLVGTEDGVYMSDDGAQSWRRTEGAGAGLEVLDLNQSPTDPTLWIAGTYRAGVLVSEDGGATWSRGPEELAETSIHAAAFDPFDADHRLVVGWETGVWLTTDGGESWAQRGDDLPTDSFYEATFDANEPGRLWVATLEEGVFTSDDDGRTWTPRGLPGTLVFDMYFTPLRKSPE